MLKVVKLTANIPEKDMNAIDKIVNEGTVMNRTQFARDAIAEKLGRMKP